MWLCMLIITIYSFYSIKFQRINESNEYVQKRLRNGKYMCLYLLKNNKFVYDQSLSYLFYIYPTTSDLCAKVFSK